MDIKAKMKEIMEFFKDNADVIYAETGITYHVMFRDEKGGDFLQSAGGERTDMFLLLMHHIDALRRCGTPETMGIDNSDALDLNGWQCCQLCMYQLSEVQSLWKWKKMMDFIVQLLKFLKSNISESTGA